MSHTFSDAARLLRTLRHLRPAQIAWRVYNVTERRLGPWRVPRLPQAPVLPDEGARERLSRFLADWAAADPPPRAQLAALRAGRFDFLNEPAPQGEPPPWHDAARSRLWRYHLHYFEYAGALARAAALGEAERGDDRRVLGWVTDWIAKNPPGKDVAWDAFTVAQRLIYWALADTAFPLQPAQWSHYARQAEYLLSHLERDLCANHLLKDACALVVAGCVLDDDQLRDRGRALLHRETAEQILADGGHYERSPMYHAQVLFDLLAVHAVLIEPPEWLLSAATRAAEFLAKMQHPDGEIPLFGDAAIGQAPRADRLISLAEKRLNIRRPATPACFALADSGFYILGPEDDRSSRLIVRIGPSGPGYQLGHARGDIFSFEWVVNGKRVLVNPGTYTYEPGPWREYARSVRAHNCVQVGGREPLEAWAAFRTGRRYSVAGRSHGPVAGGWAVAATHDGYYPFCCARRVVWDETMRLWHICDFVAGPESEPLTSFVHWHPNAHDDLGGHGPAVFPFGIQSSVTVQGVKLPPQGWYSPEFGLRLASPVLLMRTYCYKDFLPPPWATPLDAPMRVGAIFGYSLASAGDVPDAALYDRWRHFAMGKDIG